ncbi:COX15/CtaA family protein [Halapricum salinum]|nr:COX15/CtaA family protein [Halapricum salinum]
MQLRRLLAGTTGLTFVLMLLGVYTAGSGAGLTCGARWPFCDGAVFGLFPANWMSFVEWFHRLVAMVTGFVILGAAALAWRRGADRRVRFALLGSIALLPVQIGLGALTVTVGGLFPWGYSPPVQAAHYLAALSIFTLIVYATAITYAPVDRSRLRLAAVAAVALVPLGHLFSFGTVFAYTPETQIVYYGLALVLFALLVAVGTWGRRDASRETTWQASLSIVAGLLLAVQMLLGRHALDPQGLILADSVAGLVFVCLLGAAWFAYRADDAEIPLVGSLAR